MKPLITALSLFWFGHSALYAQSPNPVHWSFNSEKTGDNTWVVHCTATIDSGWHIYSQTQPNDAIARPTEIKWTTSPLILTTGKAREIGRLEHTQDKTVGIEANQYEKKVDFEQKITLRSTARMTLTGKLTFQVCTDEMCLPPRTIPVEVPLP